MKRLLCVLIVFFCCGWCLAEENLLVNGDFENGLQGWAKPWSRVPSMKAALDEQVRHGGKAAVRIEHSESRRIGASRRRSSSRSKPWRFTSFPAGSWHARRRRRGAERHALRRRE